MIIFKESNKFYMADSSFAFLGNIHQQSSVGTNPENAPMFKVRGSDLLIAAYGENPTALIDTIRYEGIPSPDGELTMNDISKKILPKIYDICEKKNDPFLDDRKISLIFAKGNKAYMYGKSSGFFPIDCCFSCDVWGDFLLYALEKTSDLSGESRIKKIYETVGKINNTNVFPVFYADTETMQVKIIEKGEND